jgi:hypothetical protein
MYINARLALVAAFITLVGVACGSSDNSPDRDVPPRKTLAAPTPTSVAVADYAIPDGPELVDAPLADAPSYLFLFTHTEDPFNDELSEERYWRIGAMLEDLAAEYPDLDPIWTIEFMGADAEAVASRNSETGLVDYLLSLNDQGLVEFGYHAHHEPTYTNRPQNQLSAEPTYDEVYDALWTWVTCRKDPTRGGCIAERGGGIDQILETFGQVTIVTGLGHSDGVQVERSAGSQAVRELLPDRLLSFGFPDHGSLTSSADYTAVRDGLLALLTPTHETSSGTFWMDNSIRINDSASLEGVDTGGLSDGAGPLAASLDAIDGTRSFVLNLGIADKYLYTVESTSPTRYGYTNPASPELPPGLLQTNQEREKGYAFTNVALDYLAERMTGDPGALQFVNATGVIGLFTSDDYWNVDAEELEQIALWNLNNWEGRPPNWAYDGEDFYSLADAFALLADALSGTTPPETRVSNTYGPWSVSIGQTAEANVPVADLRSFAAGDVLDGDRIAETYVIRGQELTATQVLYALSYLYVLDRSGVQAATITVPATATAPETLGYLEDLGCVNCLDTAWSLKPARFQDR